jgi:DNA polymerase I
MKLVYGASDKANVVALEYSNVNNSVQLFTEPEPGRIVSEYTNIPYYLLCDAPRTPGWTLLNGNLPLKWKKEFATQKEVWEEKRNNPGRNFLHIYDPRDAALVTSGITLFKGLNPNQVSTLSFDIEATGLTHGAESKVLLISNTYKCGPTIIRRLFAYDDYPTEAALLEAWCQWVVEINPTIVTGHNILTYDLPYLNYCARRSGTSLKLGRDGSPLAIDSYESKFRRDGSQFYTYNNCHIYGRHIIDTFFLSIKYDVARRYNSYALKSIIKQEGLEKADRQHYDASLIRHNYAIPEEWRKIRQYAAHDADDALALYELAIPAFFYLNRIIPKTFQNLNNTASGGQLNQLFVRAYLQDGHSIPIPSQPEKFEGAISIGNPGVYENVFKVDVASLYPSIMLQYRVEDRSKDPNGYILTILEHLTEQRLVNKRLGKETGERTYKDLDGAQKIIINSIYGMLGAPGLNFNSPIGAAEVTAKGRDIIQQAIDLALSDEMQIPNGDTDSICVCKGSMFTSGEVRAAFVRGLNSKFPERIKWEDDGFYERVLILRIKNYVLDQNGKRTIKGSALKATLKEPALKAFIEETINELIHKRPEAVSVVYHQYVKEILTLNDISRWASKKTITEAVLEAGRTNEQKVLNALEGTEYAQGDKRYFYFTPTGSLSLVENWDKANPNHDIGTLLDKLYKTIKIFSPVYDISACPNYSLKRNKIRLLSILSSPKVA